MRKRIMAVVLCIVTMLVLSASSKPSKQITIYVDDGEADYLRERKMNGENTVEYLIESLIQERMIPVGTKVNFYEITKEAGRRVLLLDLSVQFEEAAAKTGTAEEFMLIYSVANTMIKNLKVDAVRLTSEGHVIESNHAIYDELLEFDTHIIEEK